MKDKTLYTVGGAEDREDIIDFINYVFSQAGDPIDFKTFIPKVYGDHVASLQAVHFLAKQNNRIRALVAGRTEKWHVLEDTLTVGTIGNVAVHPYSRGEGHMKKLMADAMDAACAQGCDLLILHGKRQRYNYFGFEHAGWVYRHKITKTSVRHALGNVDASDVQFVPLHRDMTEEIQYAYSLYTAQPVRGTRLEAEFLDAMHYIAYDFRLIYIAGKKAGYIMGQGQELVLEDETMLPKVLKALLAQDRLEETIISVPPWQKERLDILAPLYEKRTLESAIMIRVYNWKNTIAALLRLKSSFTSLQDGELTLSIDGEVFTVRVENGSVTVTGSDRKPELVYTSMEAERALFGLEAFSSGGPYRNWFPLPLYFCPADEF